VEATSRAGLSERETEVLEAVGAHLTNAQIASKLYISVRTVESHVSSLLRKLGVADRRALAGLAPAMVDRLAAGPIPGLPSVRTSFIGRDAEQAAVLAALAAGRVVTLTGPGGVGKTRLAIQIADQIKASHQTDVLFTDLVTVSEESEGLVAQAVATLLGITDQPGRPLDAALFEELARGQRLLILDNCESLLTPVAEFTEKLLANCDGLTVLATSRERLAIAGERTVPVPPLSLATDGRDGADSEAATLFLDRAKAGDPAFTAPAEVIGEVCARLDGVPLAIELAAARCASLGADGLLAGLDDHLRLLSGSRGAQKRHRSLSSVIGWSYQLLDDQERAMFRRAGVFTGSFDLAAAAAVCTDGRRGMAADLIGRLTDKSLLTHGSSPEGSRWQMLETIRAYALDQLKASDELERTREAHLDWAVSAATDLEHCVETGQPWQTMFDAVAGDLRAALAGTPAEPSPGGVSHQLAQTLGHLAFARRFMDESCERYEAAAVRAAGPAQAAADLRTAADVARAAEDVPRAFDLLKSSAERAESAGDDAARAIALAYAVTIADRFAESFPVRVPPERLRGMLAEATRLCPPGDPVARAYLTAAAAWMAEEQPTVTDLALAKVALTAARESGDLVLLSGAYDAVVVAHDSIGEVKTAHEKSQERARLLDRLPRHDPRAGAEIPDILHMITAIAVTAGDLPYALDSARQAQVDDIAGDRPDALAHVRRARADDIADRRRYSTISKLIQPLVLQGRFDEALEQGDALWRARLREPKEKQAARWMAPAVYCLVLACGLRGDDAGRAEWRGRVHELIGNGAELVAETNLAAAAGFAEARICLHDGHIEAAVAAVASLRPEVQNWYDAPRWHSMRAYAWAIAAEVAVVANLPDAAARLAGAADAGQENYWAEACLARAAWRLHGDPADLERALAGWERIGARFERACTLTLLPGRAAEGRAELAALGCPPPATPAG